MIGTSVLIGIFFPLQITAYKADVLQQLKNPLERLSATPTPSEIKGAINFVSDKYGLGDDFYKTLFCESSFVYSAVGPSGEIGVAQYFKGTWDYFNKLRGTNLDIYNTAHQIEMTSWAWQNNMKSHWVCHRLLGYKK